MSLEQLMPRIQTLLFFNDMWHARARGSEKFFKGITAKAAVYAALSIYDDDDL